MLAWSHTAVSWTVDCAAGGGGGGYTLSGSSGGCSGSVEVAGGIRDGIPNTGGGGDGGGYFVPGGAGGDGVVVLRYCGRQCAPLPRTVASFTDVSADPSRLCLTCFLALSTIGRHAVCSHTVPPLPKLGRICVTCLDVTLSRVNPHMAFQ
jgi:hypothetical protein